MATGLDVVNEETDQQQMVPMLQKVEQTLGDVMVRSHTFRFMSPVLTEEAGVPNSCTSCHTDKPAAWAIAELKRWPEFSPWRVAR